MAVNKQNLAPIDGESPEWPPNIDLFSEIDWRCNERLVRVPMGNSHSKLSLFRYNPTRWKPNLGLGLSKMKIGKNHSHIFMKLFYTNTEHALYREGQKKLKERKLIGRNKW